MISNVIFSSLDGSQEKSKYIAKTKFIPNKWLLASFYGFVNIDCLPSLLLEIDPSKNTTLCLVG
jgi:hypothetical protein